MLLDVGCGSRPKGDINLDINILSVIIDNFVQGDALKLPFRNNCFNTVFSSGISFWRVHFDDFYILAAFLEAKRISIKQVIFEYNYYYKSNTWDVKHPNYSLEIINNNVSKNVKLNYSNNGKYYYLIRLVEIILGRDFTIKLVNYTGKSYLAKFVFNLT